MTITTEWFDANQNPLSGRPGIYFRQLPSGTIIPSRWDGVKWDDSQALPWCGSPTPPKKYRPRRDLSTTISRIKKAPAAETSKNLYKAPELMTGVLPAPIELAVLSSKPDAQGMKYLALDDASMTPVYNYANQYCTGPGFPGYPYLAELCKISEYRSPTETIALEMTREWIKLVSVGDGDNSDKLAILESEFKRHRIQHIVRKAMEHDGFYGRGQIYIRMKNAMGNDEVRQIPLIVDPATIKKGSLSGFKNVEPIWTTPYYYNAIDPTADDFYSPTSWFVLGKRTHATRLITIISREVPDMLKPSFNFGGISLSQLMEPNVKAWLKTRKSVNDAIHLYSITGLKTNMDSMLQEDAEDGDDSLIARIELFNATRDNRGLMLLNQGTPDTGGEELCQFNTPLTSLDLLQAQAQEHMSAPCHIPLAKLLGITPTGLNASTEGESIVFEDFIAAKQDADLNDPLNLILQIIQLDKFGEIDPAIGYEFVPLRQITGKELSEIRKNNADAAAQYVAASAVSPEEVRQNIATDPESGWNNLDLDDDMPPPADGEEDTAGNVDDGA